MTEYTVARWGHTREVSTATLREIRDDPTCRGALAPEMETVFGPEMFAALRRQYDTNRGRIAEALDA